MARCVLCVYYCTVCTVRILLHGVYCCVSLVQWFSMGSTGRVPVGLCFNSYCGCTIAQCVLCLYLLYSVLAWPARVMYRSFPCLYSYCACIMAQCILCLHHLYTCVCDFFPFMLDISFAEGFSHSFPSSTVKSNLCTNALIDLHSLGIFFFLNKNINNFVSRDRTHVPTR